MFDVFYFGPKPNLFEFEQYAESIEDAATKCNTGYYWYIYGGNDYTGFDFNWRPAPWEHSHLHVWPSQHQRCGDVFLAHIDTHQSRQWHFRTEQSVVRLPSASSWVVPEYIAEHSIDFTWHPDTTEGAYTYYFPSQHQSASGVEYTMPDAIGAKFANNFVCAAIADTSNWTVPEEINATTIDFSWHPNVVDPAYVYHFGSDYQESIGLIYTTPGATEIRFAGPMPTQGYHKLSVMQVLDIFYIDKGNPTAQARYDRLLETHAVTKVRYANSMIETIRRCAARAATNKFWVVSSEYDYTGFDFRWHAEPWQQYLTHVFPSQHQKWSDTFLINKHEFTRTAEWANGLEEFPNLNFVTDQSVVKTENLFNMYYVDHGNQESQLGFEILKLTYPDIVKTRFVNDYLDTFKRIINNADTEYVWILNSICDYNTTDFTWQPEPWQKEMIHCFVNQIGNQLGETQRGDTFYIHVASFKKQMIELELLDWFNVINYSSEIHVERYSVPVYYYSSDNLIDEVKNYKFNSPFVLFTNNEQPMSHFRVNTCIWSKKDRVVTPLSLSKGTVIVPRDIKAHLKSQIYDYPFIHGENSSNYYAEKQLDIIYISNGEPDEQRWYNNLVDTVQGNPLSLIRLERIKWVRGIDGRTAAYQEAARRSTTPWFFAVFAKLEVSEKFDWQWQPDYFQGPKHYIFNSHNPVNGLMYGHQGMIAYNKNLVLQNNNPGIDFTLTQPHESVPLLSGIAHFDQDAWMTWRTAFREVIKLKHFMATQPTMETEYRLNVWLTTATGKHADRCLQGAADAVKYYESVSGDYELLKLSFEWQWLREYYKKNL